MKKVKKILICISIITTAVITLVGCSNQGEIEKAINEYIDAINEKNYEYVYDKLSTESKEYITKDNFIERYQNIYSAMQVTNINIEVDESNDQSNNIPTTLTMDTIAGTLTFEDVIINTVKEDNEYKLIWDENLIIPGMQKDDKVRVQTTNATRGSIFDRDGNKLAYDGEVYSVGIHPKIFESNEEENITTLAQVLDISEEYIVDKLDKNTNPDHLVPVVNVSKHNQEVVDKANEIEGVIINTQASRVYAKGEAYGSLLGYVGDITKEELEDKEGMGYTTTSKIGKTGLEQVYEQTLRAHDGVHIYLERGSEEITIAKTHPRDGEDITLAIDSKLQEDIYNQMNGDKGASVAMDPKTGEVLAMVSSPSYDSNTRVTYTTKSIAQKWEDNDNEQFKNRTRYAYSPGSTMKLITASIGLENNVINPNEGMDIKGLNWQNDSSWGDYSVTRVKETTSPVDLYDATKYSDNIYFADKAIKIGVENYIEGAKKFGIGEEVPFEYPMVNSQIASNNEIENEILLGDTGYGQGEVLMTPLDVTMAYSALGNDGNIMVPRLVISENSEAKIYNQAINPQYLDELKRCFIAVIDDSDGTGNAAKIEGITLAGKTGTAEIKDSKDDIDGTTNGWFSAVDLDNSSIAMSIMIEDLDGKSTGQYVVPMVRNVMDNYINNKY